MKASCWMVLILTISCLTVVALFLLGPMGSRPQGLTSVAQVGSPSAHGFPEERQSASNSASAEPSQHLESPREANVGQSTADRRKGARMVDEQAIGPGETSLGALASRFAGGDPAGGKAFFEQLLREGDEESARIFLRAFSGAWSARDPAAAAAWVEELPSIHRYAAAYGLIMEGAMRDRRTIGSWILGLPEGPYKTRVVDLYGQFLAAHGRQPEDAEWAWDLLREAEDPAPFMPVVARELAHVDPDWTYDYLAGLDDEFAQRRGLRSFVEEIARHDPEPALRWAGRFDDPGLRFELSQIALHAWGTVAPREAGRWLLRSNEAEFFDDWVSALAPSLMESDPDLLNALLEDARLDPERRHYLQHVFP